MLVLAPMEGLLDWTLRDLLTRVGGVDYCVSEFIRVSGSLLPERTFLRIVPELLNNSRTPAGVPVRTQLMGSDPACVAENAARLATLGPAGIDLNFGCPARTVNRHRGGAVLLDEPELVGRIVAAVRRAVPPAVPVSAKMRLGYQDDARALDCAAAIAAGGADRLVVHARTGAQGYRPPAHWPRLARIRERVAVPVIANGEIWNPEDARRCRAESGCDALMLGRGMVADPGLALRIRGAGATRWSALLPLLGQYWQQVEARLRPADRPGRVKLWLNYLRREHPEAQQAYVSIRPLRDPEAVAHLLGTLGAPVAA